MIVINFGEIPVKIFETIFFFLFFLSETKQSVEIDVSRELNSKNHFSS